MMNTYVPLFLFLSLIGITAQEIKVKDHCSKAGSKERFVDNYLVRKI